MIEARELFSLGRGLAPVQPCAEPPSAHRPFGMRQATTIAAAVEDDLSDVTYDPASQTLTLAHPTGNPERDRLTLAKKTSTNRATDKDGSTPTTPKDFNTDSD